MNSSLTEVPVSNSPVSGGASRKPKSAPQTSRSPSRKPVKKTVKSQATKSTQQQQRQQRSQRAGSFDQDRQEEQRQRQQQEQRQQEQRQQQQRQQERQQERQQQQQRRQKGGALVDDLKNLAVPFAILLAKQGFDSMKGTTTKGPKETKKAISVSKKTAKASTASSAAKRKRTIAGGACASGCGMAGGNMMTNTINDAMKSMGMSGASKGGAQKNIKSQFDSIAKEIEEFLQKY